MIHREFREHVKDLSCISTNFCRIVIVDNNPFSFLLQPVNGIPCIPFSAGQPHDDQVVLILSMCRYYYELDYVPVQLASQTVHAIDVVFCDLSIEKRIVCTGGIIGGFRSKRDIFLVRVKTGQVW